MISGVSSIGKVVNTVASGAGKVLDKAAQIKPIQKGMALAKKDPAKFATNMLLFSIVSKDAVGCYLYTTQSLKNKKIPEEKRKFVASMDLMNGILMVGGQTIVGKMIVDKMLAPKLQAHFTKKALSDSNIQKHVAKSILDNADKLKEMGVDGSKLNIESIANTVSKSTKAPFLKGLGILTTALATTALIKRTIVPLLSTPLAGKMTEIIDKKNANKAA